MRRTYRISIASVIVISVVVVSAVCWYSLEEIHYLKSFYPRQFSMQEVFYASAVELIKLLSISVPFFLLVSAARLPRHFERSGKNDA